jgi:hypothetical protein
MHMARARVRTGRIFIEIIVTFQLENWDFFFRPVQKSSHFVKLCLAKNPFFPEA